MDYLNVLTKELLCTSNTKVMSARNMRLQDMLLIDCDPKTTYVFFIDSHVLESSKVGDFFDKTISRSNLFVGLKDNNLFITELNYTWQSNDGYYNSEFNVLLSRYNEINNLALFKLVAELLIDDKNELQTFLQEIEAKLDEESIEDAVKALSANLTKRLKDLEAQIPNLKNRITQYRASLVAEAEKLQQILTDIANFNTDNEIKDIRKQLIDILKHKKVERIEVQKNFICIYTIPLNLYEPKNKKTYYLGKMVIKIDVKSGNILFDNLDNRRNGYWINSPHPHVSSDGYACFGNIEGQIADTFTKKQYYLLFLVLLGYLETCNIDDVAGKGIKNWDEDEPYRVCVDCGEEFPESSMYRCDDCDEWVCGNCVVDIDDGMYCRDCARENHGFDE